MRAAVAKRQLGEQGRGSEALAVETLQVPQLIDDLPAAFAIYVAKRPAEKSWKAEARAGAQVAACGVEQHAVLKAAHGLV